MRKFLVQFRKEFSAYFSSYNAYIIFLSYYILSMFGALYIGEYFVKETDIMNSYFSLQPVILMLVLPTITMKSWADEAKSGTLELLLTQPISYFSLVCAKVFSAFCFFILLVFSSLFLLLLSNKLSILDMGTVLSGYTALLCCGALFIVVGCTISTVNQKNILSYVITIFVLFFITQIQFTDLTFGSLVVPLDSLVFENNYNAFLSGNFSVANLSYFILGIVFFLWLNVVLLEYKRTNNKKEKHYFRAFCLLLCLGFASIILSLNFNFPQNFDMTDNQIYTLHPEHKKYLESTNKKINITLYEALSKRNEGNSQYSSYAEFAEKIFKSVEYASGGTINVDIVLVPPFSHLERKLIFDDKIKYEEDNMGKKIYMAAKFSDNDGNGAYIKSFSSFRQNLLESDIIRILKSFGFPKPKVAVIADNSLLEEMKSFKSMLEEFYDVTYFEKSTIFIPDKYQAALVINPILLSSDFMLAMEQYVLGGGNLIVFGEPKNIDIYSGKPMMNFLKTFGIFPKPSEIIYNVVDNKKFELGVPKILDSDTYKDIRETFINGAGEVDFKEKDGYTVKPILQFLGKNIAVLSTGKYITSHLDEALETDMIELKSQKDGKLFFFYDSDFLKDALYVSELTSDLSFYDAITVADNQLFMLRTIDNLIDGQTEADVRYRHYTKNYLSIGKKILNDISESYEKQKSAIENKIEMYKNRRESYRLTVTDSGYIAAKNIGDITGIAMDIEKSEMDLYQLKNEINSNYQNVIIGITLGIIFLVPLIGLLILFGIIRGYQIFKLKNIRRLTNDA